MPLGSILTIGAMDNNRESTRKSEVGFDRETQSHSPKFPQSSAKTVRNGRREN
jgi:hypothetical protein